MLEFQVDAHPAVANVGDPRCRTRNARWCWSAAPAAARGATAANLERMGFVDVRSIAGGVAAWGEAGLPLVVR